MYKNEIRNGDLKIDNTTQKIKDEKEKILVIQLLNNKIDLSVMKELWRGDPENEGYKIIPDPKNPGYVVARQYFNISSCATIKRLSFSELRVSNLFDLYLRLILNPEPYLKKIVGKDIKIKYVLINGHSEYINGYDTYLLKDIIKNGDKFVDVDIHKYSDDFEIIVTKIEKRNERYIMKVRPHSTDSEKFIIEKDGTEIMDEYKKYNVTNYCELFKKIVESPKKFIETMFNQKVVIYQIKFVRHENQNELGFRHCKIIGIDEQNIQYNDLTDNEEIYKYTTYLLDQGDFDIEVEVNDYNTVLRIKGDPDNREWIIEPNPDDVNSFIITIRKNGHEIASISKDYPDYPEVMKTPKDLLCHLVRCSPWYIFAYLTDVNLHIRKIEFVFNSRKTDLELGCKKTKRGVEDNDE